MELTTDLDLTRALQLLQDVGDPALEYNPEQGPTMLERAHYNRKLHNMVSIHGLIPALRQIYEMKQASGEEDELGYCRTCFLLDRFLTDDPDPRIVAVA